MSPLPPLPPLPPLEESPLRRPFEDLEAGDDAVAEVDLRATDDEAIAACIGAAFPGNPKARPEVLRWQYRDNPFGETASWVDAHRLEAVRRAADRFGCVCLLKGADTLVAAPGEGVLVCPSRTHALATAGTGDVLTGVVAAFLAKGLALLLFGTLSGIRPGGAGLLAVALRAPTSWADRRMVLGLTGASAAFALLTLLWQIDIELPLPFPREVAPASAAALVGLASLRGAPVTAGRGGRQLALAFAVGLIGMTIVVPGWLWLDRPNEEPTAVGPEVRVISFNVRGAVGTGGQVDADAIADSILNWTRPPNSSGDASADASHYGGLGYVLGWTGGYVLVGVLLAPVAWKFALEDYQKSRIQTFIDPTRDARGAGYQTIQARITVGSGGLTGKGFLQGTQGQYKFLPVAHNDFIFSVLAEEQGFAGVIVTLGLYLFVILRSLEAARLAKDRLGAYLVLGVLACFTFQVIYNITMSAGLAPVKGLTLPLMSYGGSSMIATLAGFGLILNVRIRRFTN